MVDKSNNHKPKIAIMIVCFIVLFLLIFTNRSEEEMSEQTEKTVAKYACNYWENQKTFYCHEDIPEEYNIIKIKKQTYMIKHKSNFCNDLYFSGLGGKKAYTNFLHRMSNETLRDFSISEFNIRNIKKACI